MYMKIKKGTDGGWYAVFRDAVAAERFAWLFAIILRRRLACFGQYDNAYQLV